MSIEITPIEEKDSYYFKRDDYFSFNGQKGGKVRSAKFLIEEGIELYKWDFKDFNILKDNSEFIYDSNLFIEDIQDLEGKKYQKTRYYINNFKKNRNKLSIEDVNELISNRNYSKVEDLYKKWEKISGKKSDKLYRVFDLLPKENKNMVLMRYEDDNDLIGYSLTEKIYDGYINIINRYTVKDTSLVKRLSMAFHYLDSEYWNLINKNTLMNIGSSVGLKHLEDDKRRMLPIKELQLYSTKTNKKLDKETWDKLFVRQEKVLF